LCSVNYLDVMIAGKQGDLQYHDVEAAIEH